MQDQEAALAVLAVELGRELEAGGLTLALAESCTGGWIAKVNTDVAGSSLWFDRGFVANSNEAKQGKLGVAAATLSRFGAVSEEVVRAMAEGALVHSRADLSIAVSGVAGPTGGSAEKPLGSVCFAWARRDGGVVTEQRRFLGDREAVRRQAVVHALRGLLGVLRRPATRAG